MAFEGCLRLVRDAGYDDVPRLKFRHGFHYAFPSSPSERLEHLIASYHPSRQNTQTRRLTPEMLDDVFVLARSLLDGG
jgi:uracil-DNA glycosylase